MMTSTTDLPRLRGMVAGRRSALWLTVGLIAFSVLLGAGHTWAAIHSVSMNPDGIAYIEMGEAFLRGDWQTAINGYWSPVYGVLLAAGLTVAGATPENEFAVVQVVNFLIFLFALGCFSWFWRQLPRRWPGWLWLLLGYSLFLWVSLAFVGLWAVTPDMLLSAWVYLAAGLVVRIRQGRSSWLAFLGLGLVLGVAYLTKAVMFPLALVFIGSAMLSAGRWRQAVSGGLIALLAFALVAGPFILALSQAYGRFTFGESGRLNYARFVNGLPDTHWQGETSGNGVPVQPTQRILDQPPIYAFAEPFPVTYAPWYDPAYWYEGVQLQFNLRNQVGVLFENMLFLGRLFGEQQGVLIAGAVLLYWLKAPRRPAPRELSLIPVVLAALGLYALVYIETRYLAPFVVLLWADVLTAVDLPDPDDRQVRAIGVVMVLAVLLALGLFNLEGLQALGLNANIRAVTSTQAPAPGSPLEVAEALHAIGVAPGARVGVIGYAIQSFWARTARVQIVAEMYGWEAVDFWTGDAALHQQVYTAFEAAGAEAIIAENVPDYFVLADWRQINQTNYYVKKLR